MTIKYLGEDIPLALTCGATYTVLAVEKGPDLLSGEGKTDWLRIVTDIEEDYLFQLREGKDYEVIEQ